MFLRQGSSLKEIGCQTQGNIDVDLMALKVSQNNQCQAAAEAASSFPYHGLLTTKHRAAARAASPSVKAQSSSNWGASSSAAWGTPLSAEAEAELSSAWAASWAEAASSSEVALAMPSSLHLLMSVKDKVKIFNHYNDFFAARAKRQKEMIKVKSSRDRQARESRTRNPGVKNAKVYEWEKTQLSGGREVYQQVKVNKKRNEDVYSYYKPHQRLFNAFSNDWDLCEEFCIREKDKDGYDSDFGSDYDDATYLEQFVSHPTSLPGLATPMDTDEHEDGSTATTYSQDPFKLLSLVYGYVPCSSVDDVHLTLSWDTILRFLGFVGNLNDLDVPESEKSAMIKFFCTLVVSGADADNIRTADFESLQGLFAFELIQRPCEDLFVFSSLPSNACQ